MLLYALPLRKKLGIRPRKLQSPARLQVRRKLNKIPNALSPFFLAIILPRGWSDTSIQHSRTMRKEASYKADADASCFHQITMSFSRPTLSGNSIDEEVEVTVGGARYLLIPNQENVVRLQIRRPSANCSRFSSPVLRAMIQRWYLCT